MVEDCRAASQRLEKQAAALGIDISCFAVAGHSVGGSLATAVARWARVTGYDVVLVDALLDRPGY